MLVIYCICSIPLIIGIVYYSINHKEIKRNSEEFHKTEVAIALLKDKKWDEAWDFLENESPHVFDNAMNEYAKNVDFDDFCKDLSEEQYNRFKWIDSSERRIEYYKKIPEDEMTVEDWADFKASAW